MIPVLLYWLQGRTLILPSVNKDLWCRLWTPSTNPTTVNVKCGIAFTTETHSIKWELLLRNVRVMYGRDPTVTVNCLFGKPSQYNSNHRYLVPRRSYSLGSYRPQLQRRRLSLLSSGIYVVETWTRQWTRHTGEPRVPEPETSTTVRLLSCPRSSVSRVRVLQESSTECHLSTLGLTWTGKTTSTGQPRPVPWEVFVQFVPGPVGDGYQVNLHRRSTRIIPWSNPVDPVRSLSL